MKKNIREDKRFGVQFAYVLDSIYVEDVFGNEVLSSDKEKIEYVFHRFDESYNSDYEKKLYPNLQDRLGQWLRGLPSCINLAFSDYNIEQIGKSWGFCQTEKKSAKFVDSWFSVMALRLLQLRDRLCK